jgi:LuxR family transcriptional regulator, maltose regulon positive regulatory protein
VVRSQTYEITFATQAGTTTRAEFDDGQVATGPARTAAASRRTTRARRPARPGADLILASKITMPAVPDWVVQRARITALIAEGRRWCPLTVVTGPPGAGKTMALAEWAATEPSPVAWVGLDDYDNRPEVFWSYVIAALRRSGVAVPKRLSAVARGLADDEGFLLRFAAVLAVQHPPVTLVLDDLHLLTEPRALKGLDFVLRNAGAGLRLAVSSRMDPLLPLHRYRVAGRLAEIRASDLAFSSAEAGLLLAQHGCTLTSDLVESLTRRTEGWAAGLRLAAMSLAAHPDPGQFVKELATEDSALTGYLVQEVLAAQPPQVRDVALRTSILEDVSADAAVEVTGDERAAGILIALARANAFVQPIGSGRYRYHTLFREVLRLKLRREQPDRVAALDRRAARWYERNGLLTEAVRHAVRAGDWQLAAEMVIDDLAIGQILEPGDGRRLAAEFAGMPAGRAWTGPQPHLILAGAALSADRLRSCAAALAAADVLLQRVPAGQQAASGLAAAVIRLTACLRAGDLAGAAAAADRAEQLVGQVPGATLARHPDITTRVLGGRGAVELWSGHLDQATRVLATAAGRDGRPGGAGYAGRGYAGHLALAEAIRGRLGRATELAGAALQTDRRRPPGPDQDSAALVALAWVHVRRNELREARNYLRQADTTLAVSPDKLTGTAAGLAAAVGALAEGRAEVAAQIVTRARSGWSVPAWVDQQLSLVESRACTAAGDGEAALAAAKRAACDDSLEAAVTLAHACAAAGDAESARRALAPALAAGREAPNRVRLQAWLVDARLSYASGDRARGRRSLASALRLAEPEQVRLPFALERGWIGPVLQREPELAGAHRDLLGPGPRHEPPPAPRSASDQAPVLVVEPLSDREREVLRHVSGMLSTAEVASEMYISVNTVKTHLRNIYRKLAAEHRGEAVRRARQLELI